MNEAVQLSGLKQRSTRGQLFVVSAPSGSGKTTLVRMLLDAEPNCGLSISFTTRDPRGVEEHAKDYYFISKDEFREKIIQGDFAEWAEVHGNYYGTSMQEIERLLSQGFDVLFDVDHQGARALKSCYTEATLVQLLPPSMAELKRRLVRRGTDSPQVIERRFKAAWKELEHYGIFDFIVINDSLEQAFAEFQAIYRAQQNLWWRRAYRVELLLREPTEPSGSDETTETL